MDRLPGVRKAPGIAPSVAVGAGCGLLLFLIFQDGYILVAPQGRQCILAAYSLQQSAAFALEGGARSALFGPLYPLLLAAGGKLGLGVVPAVVAVNALTFAASALAFHALACLLSIRRAIAATLFFVALAANYYFFRMARPDAIVPLMAMLTVLGTVRYARTHERWLLVAIAVASAAAASARYMGVFTVVPVALLGVVWLGREKLRDRLLDSAIFAVIALAPVGLWLLRNRSLTGYLTGRSRSAGPSHSANTDLLSNLIAFADTVRLDFVGWRAMGVRRLVHEGQPLPFPDLTTAATVAAALLVALLLAMGSRSFFRFLAAEARARSDLGRTAMLVAAHGIVHVVALLTIWTVGNNDPIHTRYTAPVYWCAILFAFLAVEAWRETTRGRLLVGVVLALGLVVGAANIDKSILLFGDAPADDLIKKSLHAPSDLWRRDLAWGQMSRSNRTRPSEIETLRY